MVEALAAHVPGGEVAVSGPDSDGTYVVYAHPGLTYDVLHAALTAAQESQTFASFEFIEPAGQPVLTCPTASYTISCG